MSLSQALVTAVNGLRVTQVGMSIVAGNVANAETPNYQAKDIPFQRILEGSLHSDSSLQLINTHPAHFPIFQEASAPVETSGDGVNLDQEMANLAENNLMFQAGVQSLGKKLEALKMTISEGR